MKVKLSNGWEGDLYLFNGETPHPEYCLMNAITGEVLGNTFERKNIPEFIKNEFYKDNNDIIVKDINDV